MKPILHVLRLPKVHIFRQLRLEELLMRKDPDNRNFLVINQPENSPSIVHGISGKPELLVHENAAYADGIPMIRRYTGGGTVYIDDNIRGVSLIVNKAALPNLNAYPDEIMKWTERVYRSTFNLAEESFPSDWVPFQNYVHPSSTKDNIVRINPNFSLNEVDYCFGAHKFGGNAQGIIRTKWAHHTSFLWNLNLNPISKYLTLPSKRPKYRGERNHGTFLCPLSPFFPPELSSEEANALFEKCLVASLEGYFRIEVVEDVEKEMQSIESLASDHAFQTKFIDFSPSVVAAELSKIEHDVEVSQKVAVSVHG